MCSRFSSGGCWSEDSEETDGADHAQGSLRRSQPRQHTDMWIRKTNIWRVRQGGLYFHTALSQQWLNNTPCIMLTGNFNTSANFYNTMGVWPYFLSLMNSKIYFLCFNLFKTRVSFKSLSLY